MGVARDATPQQVKVAYRRQAKRNHPDLHPDPGAVTRMAEVNRAYELLSDGLRRAAWDAAHPVQVPRPSPRPGASGGAGGAPQGRATAEPVLAQALAYELTFGKFRGRTLGFVAAQDPGYIAWIVRTIGNRPEVVKHARVVLAHLESSGWRDTPRPPRTSTSRPAGAGAGAHGAAGASWNAGAGAGPAASSAAGPRPAARPAPTQRSTQGHGDHAGLGALGLAALGGAAWFAGIPAETVSSLVFLAACIGWPLWLVVQNHRGPADLRRTSPHAWRAAVGEVVFVAVLLAVGWAMLQGIIEGPQPGDIVCEVYDLRLGDCVVESVYEGE